MTSCHEFVRHARVNHKKGEYSRGDVTTNTVEGFFSLPKRGIRGVYHHVGAHHLYRYRSEFDFPYNARKVSDAERTDLAIAGFEGKRKALSGGHPALDLRTASPSTR
jgi:ISXO2 transposase-like protein